HPNFFASTWRRLKLSAASCRVRPDTASSNLLWRTFEMAFCPNCGASVEGRFCAKCGASVPAASGSNAGAAPSGYGDPQGAQQGYGQSQYNQAPTASGLTDNVAGALCYVLGLITGIVFLVLAPYNQRKFVRFHAFQSIFFHVAFIVVMIAEMVIGAILPWWI